VVGLVLVDRVVSAVRGRELHGRWAHVPLRIPVVERRVGAHVTGVAALFTGGGLQLPLPDLLLLVDEGEVVELAGGQSEFLCDPDVAAESWLSRKTRSAFGASSTPAFNLTAAE
jgi:hypothetical protein